jgi:subtilisin-like proprotein convertase family protein
MVNPNQDYYYVGDRKVKLMRLPDSFAVRYRQTVSPRAMIRKLMDSPDFTDVEEQRALPRSRMVIVTLPPTRGAVESDSARRTLEADADVEFVAPVYREPQSGLRMVATDEITVRFKPGVSQDVIDIFNADQGITRAQQSRFVPNQYILTVSNPSDVLAIADRYHTSDLTEFAEPNFVTEAKKSALPNDEFLPEQWHLKNTGQGEGKVGEDVEAEGAWTMTSGSPTITVAVIDDGVDIDHPDLKDNIWTNPNSNDPDVHGWDFYNDNADPRPKQFAPPYDRLVGNDSHGTPCAGVIAALGNNQEGVAGIAHQCKILPVKIFMADDLVPFNVLADAIRYGGQKADVLSNSWGIPQSNDVAQAIRDVVKTGRGGKGCPVFVATGNDYSSSIGFPASVDEAIAVGASTNEGRRAAYSNYGRGLDIVAPSSGGSRGIFTVDVSIPGRGFNVGTVNSGDAEGRYTNSFGGTSSATPLAAGVAALILSLNPELTWEQVRAYLRHTADKIDTVNGSYIDGYSRQYGFGRINARRALEAVKQDLGDPRPGAVIEKVVTPNLPIPDHDPTGIRSSIEVTDGGAIAAIEGVSVDITHTYRGDLLVSFISPAGTEIKLHQGEGGGADNLTKTYTPGTTPALHQLEGQGVQGTWVLQAIDRWAKDVGQLNRWGFTIRTLNNRVTVTSAPGLTIPDNNPAGIVNRIRVEAQGQVKDIRVGVNISHTYIQDLTVKLNAPSGKTVTLHNRTGGGADDIQQDYTPARYPQLTQLINEPITGDWALSVSDQAGLDVGKLNQWELDILV